MQIREKVKIKLLKAKLFKNEPITERFRRVWFDAGIENFDFVPGQFVNVKFDSKTRRSYSLAGTYENARYLETFVDISPNGPASKFFASAAVGESLDIIGPLGEFVYQRTPTELLDSPTIFLATGTGITPIISIIEGQLLKYNSQRQLKLYWGVRYERETFLIERLQQLQERFSNFSFEICMSQPGADWKGYKGYCTHKLDRDWMQLTNIDSADFYICGAGAMLGDAVIMLNRKGISSENIYTEKFY